MNEIAKKIIKIDEQSNKYASHPYYCHKNYPTIGWGFRIAGTSQYDPLPDITMTQAEADIVLDEKISELIEQFHSNDFKKIFPRLNDVRQAVLISMAFQVGMYGLLKFRNMRRALAVSDYDKAAAEIIDSAAWRDPLTRDRFTRNAEMMRTGKLLDYYR